jgi:hypothetical protein
MGVELPSELFEFPKTFEADEEHSKLSFKEKKKKLQQEKEDVQNK